MLFGDRTKLLGKVFGITFASLLIAQQSSIFCGLMLLTTGQIRDINDAELWIMSPGMENMENIKSLRDMDLLRVRGVSGIAWAVSLFKSQAPARLLDGDFRSVILIGVDDATLVGAPREFLAGSLEGLRQPEAVIIDRRGWEYLWPGEPIELGRTFEMNDHRAQIVGVCQVSQPFQATPVIFTPYSRAVQFVPPRRNVLSFILAQSDPNVSVDEAACAVSQQANLVAKTRIEFLWTTIWYFMKETGIPVNFGITVLLGFLVGTAVAGQTFYLFTVEDLRQYATLKAMGATNKKIVAIVSLQGALVGMLGSGILCHRTGTAHGETLRGTAG